MRRAVTTNPLTLGYGFSSWSVARLAGHLAKTTGTRFGPDQRKPVVYGGVDSKSVCCLGPARGYLVQ